MLVKRYSRWCLRINFNDHVPPHCHVRFPDKSEIRVEFPVILPMDGATISKEIEDSIIDNLDKLAEAWDKYHQPKKYKKNKTNK